MPANHAPLPDLDPLALARALIRCPSVTPDDSQAQSLLAASLAPSGFQAFPLRFGAVQNLFLRRGHGAPHLCFAGHTDVVPAGAGPAWTHPPFSAEIHEGFLYGRGAVDMKGGLACAVSAVHRFITDAPSFNGSISFLITGDEEGVAVDGTVKVLAWMAENGHIPDFCLVAEPSNPDHLGEQIKIGRRGSLTGTLRVRGRQGHAAYPHLAANPLPVLIDRLSNLLCLPLGTQTVHFQPSHLEITSIDTGNTASNVIPESAQAVFNIRFNDQWTGETLSRHIQGFLAKDGVPPPFAYDLALSCGAECFLTPNNAFVESLKESVRTLCNRNPALTTGGGTSDARFIARHCPVAEFGLTHATAHHTDERTPIEDIYKLTDVYEDFLKRFFKV